MELSPPVFTTYGLSRLGFEHRTFRLRGERSNPLRHRRGWLPSLPSHYHSAKRSALGASVTGPRRWPLMFAPCHSTCGTLKNPHCWMAISTCTEHRSKFAALHRQWWRLQMSEKSSSKMKNTKQTNKQQDGNQTNQFYSYFTRWNFAWVKCREITFRRIMVHAPMTSDAEFEKGSNTMFEFSSVKRKMSTITSW